MFEPQRPTAIPSEISASRSPTRRTMLSLVPASLLGAWSAMTSRRGSQSPRPVAKSEKACTFTYSYHDGQSAESSVAPMYVYTYYTFDQTGRLVSTEAGTLKAGT